MTTERWNASDAYEQWLIYCIRAGEGVENRAALDRWAARHDVSAFVENIAYWIETEYLV